MQHGRRRCPLREIIEIADEPGGVSKGGVERLSAAESAVIEPEVDELFVALGSRWLHRRRHQRMSGRIRSGPVSFSLTRYLQSIFDSNILVRSSAIFSAANAVEFRLMIG